LGRLHRVAAARLHDHQPRRAAAVPLRPGPLLFGSHLSRGIHARKEVESRFGDDPTDRLGHALLVGERPDAGGAQAEGHVGNGAPDENDDPARDGGQEPAPHGGPPLKSPGRSIRRPSAAELAAAVDRTVPDLVSPRLRVLFCGINPGLYSGAVGHHFARPGNRFWRALHGSGLTPRLLGPFDEHALPAFGLGITNLVERATAGAAQLDAAEIRAGAEAL